MVYILIDKTSAGSGVNMHANNEKLAEELHRPIIRGLKKRTVYSGFKDNIFGANLADSQMIRMFNEILTFLMYLIDIFSKYAWVVPLKDKKGVSIVNAFQKILNYLARKHGKI